MGLWDLFFGWVFFLFFVFGGGGWGVNAFYYPRGNLAMSHHLTFDIVLNNFMHTTNNRSYIRLKSESE